MRNGSCTENLVEGIVNLVGAAEWLKRFAAFAPDKAESVTTLIAETPPGAPVSPILPPTGGFLLQDRAKFQDSFGGDLAVAGAAFMADSLRHCWTVAVRHDRWPW